MANPSANAHTAQYAGTPDSDSDSQHENPPTVNPRANLNPPTSTATNATGGPWPSHIEDPSAFLHELRQREIDLARRTTDLEKLLVSVTTAINQQHQGPTTSTPVTQTPFLNNPYIPAFTTPNPPLQQSTTIPSSFYNPQSSQFIYPESVIREALDLVPKFDGFNISVLQFTRACKRAKELIPFMNESNLVRLLRNKLTNHAYLAIEDETHDSVDKFLDSLKRTFGPSRNSNYYRGQLSANYKKQSEHILDYIGRVKDLRSAIIDEDQTQLARPLAITEIAYIDSFTLESFIEGLPAEYRVEIRVEGIGNLKDAYNKAIMVSKRLERDHTRFFHPRNQQAAPISSSYPPAPPPRPPNPPITILQRPNSRSQPVNQTPSPHVSSVFPVKFCNYCGKMGHLISECRKRQANNLVKENRDTDINRQQGNAPVASAASTSRGPTDVRTILPVDVNPPPSTSSDPQQ